MSWYCERWATSLQEDYADNTFENGDEWDDIFNEARCNNFSRSATAYINANDDVSDYETDDGADAYCNTHVREATWDATYSVSEDLETAGFALCHDCETVYHNQNALDEHMTEDHEDDDRQPFNRHSARPTVTTSHSNWPT